MPGCRPFKKSEVHKILDIFESKHFDTRWARRNQALVWLGICTGFRIKELLSIRIEDIYKYGEVLPEVTRPRRFMKNKKQSRSKRLYPPAQKAIKKWIVQLKEEFGATRKTFLFTSKKGGRIGETQAYRILNKAAVKARIPDNRIGTHSLRKTFADRMYEYYYKLSEEGAKIDVMFALQQELDHEDISTTYRYMEFRIDQDKPDDLFDKYDNTGS